MKGRFDGEVVLVTGGASGIGRSTALAFGREGAEVIVADVDAVEGEKTVRDIKRLGGDALFIRTDVSKAGDVEALIEAIIKTFGRLDCAFNNSGIEGKRGTTLDYSEEAWNRVISINLTGVWLCMKYELRQMTKQGSGVIVNMSSILGRVGFAEAPAYVAAKHGVIGLTKAAALENAQKGIRVNAVCPGFIQTPMLERAGVTTDRQRTAAMADLHPMKRLGKPEEVAETVLWLCSDAASFVTGHSVLIDGGYTAQ